jgi:hypothetical protein
MMLSSNLDTMTRRPPSGSLLYATLCSDAGGLGGASGLAAVPGDFVGSGLLVELGAGADVTTVAGDCDGASLPLLTVMAATVIPPIAVTAATKTACQRVIQGPGAAGGMLG